MRTTEQKRRELVSKAKGERPSVVIRVRGIDDDKIPKDTRGTCYIIVDSIETKEMLEKLGEELEKA